MTLKFLQQYRRPIWITASILLVYALAGFFLAPWLVKKNAVEVVADRFGAELSIERVAINPFVLRLQIDGVALDDPSGSPFLRVGHLVVNFQLSSLFRRAWTFDEVRIDAPEVFLARDREGNFNFGFLVAQPVEPLVAEKTGDPSDAEPARLLIFDFAINDSVVNWLDEVPAEPVETRFGPVNIAIDQLNTLPDRPGQQAVVITTETSGTLAWTGSIHLNPLMSVGHASVKGSHFPLASAYLKHEIGFDIVDGTSDVEFDYRVALLNDGTVGADVTGLNLSFDDVQVRTFSEGHGVDEPDRDVLQLSRMSLAGGSIRWPEREVAVQSLAIDDALVSLYRNATGRLNIVPAESGPAPDATKPAVTKPESRWSVSLAEFKINRMGFGLEDDSVDPAAEIGVRSLDVSIRDISNEPLAAFPTSLALIARTGGSVSMDGTIAVLPTPVINLDVRVDDLALAGAHPYLQPLVDLNLDSGALNLSGNLSSSDVDPLLLTGDLQVADFLITETEEGSRLGSWTSLEAHKLTLSLANRNLDISEIKLDQPYADVLIAEGGSVNLGRARKGIQRGDEEDSVTDPAAVEEEISEAEGKRPFAVTVGRVIIENASADFADHSLPLPFDVQIAELSGELSTIATESAEPSVVSLEGKVDEFGLVRVTGHATPVDFSANTDMQVVFENIEVPKFSAYSVPFAGREIASGRLDLELGYKVTASALEGENNVVLRDFELGDKVDHPGAASLPLGLAVALLKDPDGRIDIDLPVRGNVDDPEFKYGGVVRKAIANLIIGIVASPFKLLAGLVGAESSELEYLRFADGRSDLTPPELEKAAKVAEALGVRPELMLRFGGVVDPEADGLALRTASFEAEAERRVNLLAATESDDAKYAEHRFEVIEQLYRESEIEVHSDAVLAELRTTHTTFPADGASDGEEKFDVLAYTQSLRSLLIEHQPLTDQELSELAAARAGNARAAIIAANPELEARVEILESSTVSRDDDEAVRMQMSLTTSAGGGQ